MREAVTVSQLNRYIKELFSDNNILRNVMVKGEVSNLKESRGNYYFSLKDEQAAIQCIVFTNYSGASVDLSNINDGAQIIVYGKVAVYEKGGTYAIYVSKIENSGLGEYFIKLEELKKKLSELGMFDESYKKEIPKYSRNIGVVTAENGAAIRDIFKTIKDKNPYANVVLYPSLVQGENAYKTIVDGIMELDKMDLDVIIVGRGGGSIEINDSISDLVADKRVATPTAAGELATFSYEDFENDIENYKLTIDDIIEKNLDRLKEKLDNAKKQISFLSPRARIDRYKDNLKHVRLNLKNSINSKVQNVKSELRNYIEMLKSRDPLESISKGMAYTTNKSGKKIKSIKDVKIGTLILSRIKDGTIESQVTKIIK